MSVEEWWNETVAQTLGHVALLVRNYEEAIAFFTQTLRFRVIEDTDLGNGKRWVLVGPVGSHGTALLLAHASTPEQAGRVGNQAGGRVFLFLQTDDFWHDYRDMKMRGVKFREDPREETYGTVAVFEDLYGNKWDLLEPRRLTRAIRRENAMRMLDRVLGWLLVVGGLLHAMGSSRAYHNSPELLLWALSASLAAVLLAALNLLRASRPQDRPLAWVSLGGCVAWIAVALGFGHVIGNAFDPRALIHAINAAALAAMSVRTIVRSGGAAQRVGS